MECPNPKPSVVVVPALILLVLAMAAGPGIALKLEPTGTSSHIPPLLHCAPAPAGAGAAPSSNHSAFRANVLSLLGALPAAAAAAPTGFAAAHSGAAVGGDRAFARAFCFGFGAHRGSSPDNCLDCLSAAAHDVADGCHGRRGAVWRTGCFLRFADTNTSTAREDAFRGWFYDSDGSPTPTAALGSQCLANGTAADCSRCLDESANVVAELKKGRLSLVYGDDEAMVVVGYSCYLRVLLYPPSPRWQKYVFGAIGIFDLVAVVLIEVFGLLLCIHQAQELNPA